MSIAVTRGDITKVKCDAIVNPIGSGLYTTELDGLACGKSKVTTATSMPYKFVIHTAKPMWRVSSTKRHKVLDFTYKDAVKVAIKQGYKSIAVPLVMFSDDEANGYLALDDAKRVLEKLITRFKLKMHIYIAIIEKKRDVKSGNILLEIEKFFSEFDEAEDDIFGTPNVLGSWESYEPLEDDKPTLYSDHVSTVSVDDAFKAAKRAYKSISKIKSRGGFNTIKSVNNRLNSEYKFTSNERQSDALFGKSSNSAPRGLTNRETPKISIAGLEKTDYCFISYKKSDTEDRERPEIAIGESGSVLWDDDFDFANEPLDKFLKKRNTSGGFAKTLFEYIDKRELEDAEAYKKAKVSKQTFSKIKNPAYKPSKATVLLFALGLRLTIEETEHLLSTAGFCLSRSDMSDAIVEYFIRSGKYNNVDDVNDVLYEYGYALINAS